MDCKRETMRSKSKLARKSSKKSALAVNRIFWRPESASGINPPVDYSRTWARENDETGQRISWIGRTMKRRSEWGKTVETLVFSSSERPLPSSFRHETDDLPGRPADENCPDAKSIPC
jgi:hypothetical protein